MSESVDPRKQGFEHNMYNSTEVKSDYAFRYRLVLAGENGPAVVWLAGHPGRRSTSKMNTNLDVLSHAWSFLPSSYSSLGATAPLRFKSL